MTVRARLTLWNVAIFALVLVALGITLRALLVTTLRNRVEEELAFRAEPMVAFWPTGSLLRKARDSQRRDEHGPPQKNNEIPDELRKRMRDLRDSTPLQYQPRVFRLDETEMMRGSSRNKEDASPPVSLAQIRWVKKTAKPAFLTQDNIRIYTTPLFDDQKKLDAVCQTALSLDSLDREVGRLTQQMLTLLPLALFLVAIGGLFLTDRALRPVRQVTDAAARIGEKDLSERLPVSGKDEFAKLATTFNGMLARLEAAFERQRQFVADASHELKTPLTVIKANTSLALAEESLPTDYQETLTEIDRAADRTSRIVSDLLLLAKSDGGQLPIERREIRLSDLFAEAAREARRLHPKGAPLAIEAQNEVISGDVHLLHRLALNLIDNALRHTPSDGLVTLIARPNGFCVRDSGVGIAPEHLPHLTERFYRVDSSRARSDGGSGLGLAISRAIAEAHHGTLQIDSTLGQGTSVSVTLGA
jgi:signal transduction histidine kinase